MGYMAQIRSLISIRPFHTRQGSCDSHTTTQSCTTEFKLWFVYATQDTFFLRWSVEDEVRSVTAWEKKLLRIMVVWQRIPLYLLPGGVRVNRLKLGWVSFLCVIWALCWRLTSLMSLMRNIWEPMTFCSLLNSSCRAVLSWVAHKPC